MVLQNATTLDHLVNIPTKYIIIACGDVESMMARKKIVSVPGVGEEGVKF